MAARRTKVAIIAPSRALDRSVADAVTALAAKAYGPDRLELVIHPQCFLSAGHFAGTDAERAAAFRQVANDPEIDAVWFARGGYGACRILETVPGGLNEAARRKTFLGYSDTGNLLAALYRDGIGTVVHGPMPADLVREGGPVAVRRALDFLVGQDRDAALEPSTRAPGRFAAFNISVLVSLIGTPWMPDLKGHVLLLEDVGEYHYRLDRMLFNITSNPGIRDVAGIRLGRCSAIPKNDIDFQMTEEEIVAHWCARNTIAYLGRADIGHDAGNKIVVFGENAR
jgi:muramoyltetrapeptide carboxypeptidase